MKKLQNKISNYLLYHPTLLKWLENDKNNFILQIRDVIAHAGTYTVFPVIPLYIYFYDEWNSKVGLLICLIMLVSWMLLSWVIIQKHKIIENNSIKSFSKESKKVVNQDSIISLSICDENKNDSKQNEKHRKQN